MIVLMKGNVIEADAEALVNTVNCDGFMGKGIALQFKQAYPENFRVYERACRAGEVEPGRMLVFPTNSLVNPKLDEKLFEPKLEADYKVVEPFK